MEYVYGTSVIGGVERENLKIVGGPALREGEYLLHRHQILHRFFCALNGTEDELEQVEKVEHFMSRETMENLEKLTIRLEG